MTCSNFAVLWVQPFPRYNNRFPDITSGSYYDAHIFCRAQTFKHFFFCWNTGDTLTTYWKKFLLLSASKKFQKKLFDMNPIFRTLLRGLLQTKVYYDSATFS